MFVCLSCCCQFGKRWNTRYNHQNKFMEGSLFVLTVALGFVLFPTLIVIFMILSSKPFYPVPKRNTFFFRSHMTVTEFTSCSAQRNCYVEAVTLENACTVTFPPFCICGFLFLAEVPQHPRLRPTFGNSFFSGIFFFQYPEKCFLFSPPR